MSGRRVGGCGSVRWRSRDGALRPPVAVVVVAGLVGSLLTVVPARAEPALPAAEPVAAPAAGDQRTALATARVQGRRVEVRADRTEFSQTFATPQGTFVVEEHLRPQWVRSAGGQWVDADPSLRQGPGGAWRPVAAAVAMEFSGGGREAPLASIRSGGVSVGLRWPGTLPEPVVAGNVVTYRDVAPAVDLQVVADVDGFTHLVVLRSPKALAQPGVDEIVLGTELSGGGLQVTGAGVVEAVDRTGSVVLSGPAPMMWDSRDVAGGGGGPFDPGPKPVPGLSPSAGGADVQPAMARVAVSVSAGTLTLVPDQQLLRDPDTVYPVYVDPTWVKVTGGRNKWSLLRKSFPGSSFFNPAVGSTSSSDATKGIVRAGFVVEDRTYTDRSIFNMSTSAVRFKRVNKATFSLTQGWSWYNCGSSTRPVTELRSVGSFGSSTTWDSQPSWGGVLATSNKIRKHGYSCGPQRVEYNLTSRVRSAAAAGSSSINLGLRARSESTGNWTRFRTDARLSMEYNTAPNAPGTLKVTGKGCATGSTRPYVTVDRPTFSAKVSDKDSGQQSMTTRFYWWKSGLSRSSSDFVSGTSANPGTANSASVPASKALADQTVYKFQARTDDGIDVTWSNVCEFKTSLVPPDPPAGLASTAYPELDPGDPGLGSGGVGVSGGFTISPPVAGLAEVVGYAYSLDSGVAAAVAPVAAKGAGGGATVTLRPSRDGVNILQVWTKDVAGRFSTPVEYRFQVRAGEGPAAWWVFDDPAARGLDDTGHGNLLTLHGDAVAIPGRAGVGEALALDGSGDYATIPGPVTRPHPDTGGPVVVRTDATFTVAAWARPAVAPSSGQLTVLSADGTTGYAYTLGYSASEDRWRFAMAESDATSPTLRRVFSDVASVVGRWTHLAATYDAGTGQLRLYVNGVLQADLATLASGFHATGPVAVGRRLWNGSHTGSQFHGQIDDVRVYPYLVEVADLVDAARPLPPVITFPDGDTATVGGTLRVRFDAAGDINVTSFRYSVGSDDLDQTVPAGSPGGTATVTVPVQVAGELSVVAATMAQSGHVSPPAEAVATVVGEPGVSGVVHDQETGEPVAGATVVLDQAGLSVTSGPDGSFSFDGFEAGTYTLAAHLGGQCGMATATELEIVAPVVVELRLTPARDSFGYQCQEAPGTPFVPIGGAALALTGDDAVAQVSLPFGFPFYGEVHTSAWVDTNGLIAFADPGGSHPAGDTTIPSPAEPNALIAAYWADLVVDAQASVRTELVGVAPERMFTVEWRDVHLSGDSTARLSVQATLHEAGHIFLNYTGMDTADERGQQVVVGVESPGGQLGVQFSYKQSVLATDLMIVVVYPEVPNPITTVTLSGTVVDSSSGQPAAGVEVSLEPAELSVTSEADGSFSFPDLEWGSYLVAAQTGSHCAWTGQQHVQLEGPTDIEVDLAPATDEYGYTCAVGPRSFLPVATELALAGDDNNQSVTVPFPVTLYGETFSQVWVNTNGILIFAPQGFPWWVPHEIPSVHYSPSAAIYPFWSDWEVDASAGVWTGTGGTAPSRTFTVEWRNVVHRHDATARVSFQVVLYEATGEIAVAWSGVSATNPIEQGSKAVVGIENIDGTIALPHQVFDQAIASGQGVLFTPGDPGLHEVSGVVTCDGAPVAGVDVRVGDQDAVTDPAGGFGFTGVPPGPQGLVASAAAGDCAGSVAGSVTAVRGEPEFLEVELDPVAEAVGYTVTRPSVSMLAASSVVTLPGNDGGDDELVQVTPPFPVKLYGQAYSQAWLDTNGYLMFENRGFADPVPFSIPSTEWSPDAAVYPFWNDWVVDSLASVRTGVHGTAPHRAWVVEWRNVHPFNMWQRVSFQVVFEETTGRISFAYQNIDPMFVERGGAGLSGVENSDSSAAIQYSFLAPVIRTGRGLIFTPVVP